MKYTLRVERMGGDIHYMIYRRILFMDLFFERWNTCKSGLQRLDELNNSA